MHYDPRPRTADHGDPDSAGAFEERPSRRSRATTTRAPSPSASAGPVGSGKTALLLALCRALRDDYSSPSSPTTSSRARTPSS